MHSAAMMMFRVYFPAMQQRLPVIVCRGVIPVLLLALAGCAPAPAAPTPAAPTPTVTASPTPGPTVTPYAGQSIPLAPTLAETPTPWLVSLPGVTPLPPGGTPLFPLPTRLAETPPPTLDCADVYPPDAVLTIAQGSTTVEQAVAAFGPVLSVSGRPPRYRFEDRGCTLILTMGTTYVQAAELSPYFSLDDLLSRYGDPPAAAQIRASIRLPGRDRLGLLYPEMGLAALFEDPPVRRSDTIPELRLVAPTDLAGLLRALGDANATVLEHWQPPLF